MAWKSHRFQSLHSLQQRCTLIVIGGMLCACQPSSPRALILPCLLERPSPGETVLRPVGCEQELIAGGEGRTSDWLLATHAYRAILRHPQASLTLPGTSGGTIIDFAPWGYRDRLHEIVPLIDGGWLDVNDLEIHDNDLILRGHLAPLPGQPHLSSDAEHEVTWTVEPDSPWLQITGADSVWIHAATDVDLLGKQLATTGVQYSHDALTSVDLGGAIIADGASAVIALSPIDPLDALYPTGARIEGTAEGATHIRLFEEGETVGRVPVSDGHFESQIPTTVEWIRAEGDDLGPSEFVAPGVDLDLSLTALGSVSLFFSWQDTAARPVRIEWTDPDLGLQWTLMPANGGTLSLPEANYLLTATAGPGIAPRTLMAEVRSDLASEIAVAMKPQFKVMQHAFAAIRWPSDRSPTYRGSNHSSLTEAVSEGIQFAVLAPENDVADAPSDTFEQADIHWRNGSTVTHPDGWTISSWPWSANARRAGHGAPNIRAMSPEDALAAVFAGPGTNRWAVVDLPWLAVSPPPWSIHPKPTCVRLGTELTATDFASELSPWFQWLDAGVPLSPIGPRNWIEVNDPTQSSAVEFEAGLIAGRTVASTGPMLSVDVWGAHPGDIAILTPPAADPEEQRPPAQQYPVHLMLQHDGTREFTLTIFGEAGQVLHQSDAPNSGTEETVWIDDPGRWLVVHARSSDTQQWAITAPIWFEPPGNAPTETAP